MHERAPGRTITTPPVKLLRDDELLERDAARDELGLRREGRYALLSLGPGNLKDLGDIAPALVDAFRDQGFEVVWARAPITVRDVPLPETVIPISKYPLVRYMRAFDAFAGAAGYNTCCEVVQAGIPSLLVPNRQVADDQSRRAQMVAEFAPVVVSPCETDAQRQESLQRLLALGNAQLSRSPEPDGAQLAADEILSLVATMDRP